jgi:FkbM family methyltransferase
MLPSVRRYRMLRAVVRAASVPFLGKRKAVVERLLRAAFGDTVEARRHLIEVHPADRVLGSRLRRRGTWSRAETALYERCIRRGETVVDCGANVGYFTLIFARRVGPGGRVFAFEPEPGNFRLLERNIARNGYRNVTAVPWALSREEGTAPLCLAPDNLGDHRLGPMQEERQTVTVQVTTLDASVAARAGHIDFLKLDVQGREPAVLDGAHEVLEANPRMWMLTEFWPRAIAEAGDDPAAFLTRIAAAGFSIAVLEPSGRTTHLATETDRRRICTDATDVNLVCWRGRPPLAT